MDPADASYRDSAASFWSRTEKRIQSDFVCRPQSLALLGDVRDKVIADLGAGDGYCARLIAEAGASRVLAVEKNQQMAHQGLERESSSPVGIDFIVAGLEDLDQHVEPRSVAGALCINVAPHLTRQALRECLDQVARVLVDGAVFVLAMPAPALFSLPALRTKWIEITERSRDANGEATATVLLRTGSGEEVELTVYTHEESDLPLLLGQAGLPVRTEVRPLASERDLRHFPDVWGEEAEVPFYVIYQSIKT
jgi:ubiquinone/menaquinone biosynthesis C-methylase UbiE